MTYEEMQQQFESCGDLFLKFEDEPHKLHRQRRIHALMLLDKFIQPKETVINHRTYLPDVIEGAEHDVIFLDLSPEDLAEQATPADIVSFSRAGVYLSREYDSLCMFV